MQRADQTPRSNKQQEGEAVVPPARTSGPSRRQNMHARQHPAGHQQAPGRASGACDRGQPGERGHAGTSPVVCSSTHLHTNRTLPHGNTWQGRAGRAGKLGAPTPCPRRRPGTPPRHPTPPNPSTPRLHTYMPGRGRSLANFSGSRPGGVGAGLSGSGSPGSPTNVMPLRPGHHGGLVSGGLWGHG